MILTSRIPVDWRALQAEVGCIWRECGFSVEVEPRKSTVRGNVEIDVFAKERISGRVYTYACECKLWKAAVPQTVVHAFRTVVTDLGVNQGYIVSTGGFQAGAHEAADRSNIKLLTWEQWQTEFCPTWIKNHLVPTVTDKLDDLFSFTEPLAPNWFYEVPEDEKRILRELREKHCSMGALMMTFTPYMSFLRPNGFPELPLRRAATGFPEGWRAPPDAVLDAEGYKDFLEAALLVGEAAITEFEDVRKRSSKRSREQPADSAKPRRLRKF